MDELAAKQDAWRDMLLKQRTREPRDVGSFRRREGMQGARKEFTRNEPRPYRPFVPYMNFRPYHPFSSSQRFPTPGTQPPPFQGNQNHANPRKPIESTLPPPRPRLQLTAGFSEEKKPSGSNYKESFSRPPNRFRRFQKKDGANYAEGDYYDVPEELGS